MDPTSADMANIFTYFFGLGLACWVSIRILNILARMSPGWAGRMKASYLARNNNCPRHVLMRTAYPSSEKQGGMMHQLSNTTKRTANLASPREREAPAKAVKVMRLYVAEGWQGVALTSLTVACALLLCGAACSCCGNKVVVLGALGPFTAPHAHPQHTYVRTLQWVPVASIDPLRMTVIEHGSHTRSEPRSSSSEQHLARSRWCSVFRAFTSLFVIFRCIPFSWSYISSSKPKLSFWVLASSFKPDSGLVWRIACCF